MQYEADTVLFRHRHLTENVNDCLDQERRTKPGPRDHGFHLAVTPPGKLFRWPCLQGILRNVNSH